MALKTEALAAIEALNVAISRFVILSVYLDEVPDTIVAAINAATNSIRSTFPEAAAPEFKPG